MPQEISEEHVAAYLDALERSGVLGKSRRRLKLIDYLIRAELAGKGNSLKAYAIGLDVFGKPADFDPSTDSIVRVEIGRLRNALALFEAGETELPALHVEIPIGTYRPNLSLRTVNDTRPAVQSPRLDKLGYGKWLLAAAGLLAAAVIGAVALFFSSSKQDAATQSAAITVVLTEFRGHRRLAQRSRGIIMRSLIRNGTLEVLDGAPVPQLPATQNATFLLNGQVWIAVGSGYRIEMNLVNQQSAEIVWSKSALVDNESDIENSIRDLFAREVRVQLFGSTKRQLEERPLDSLSPEELFVMATWVPGPAQNAFAWEEERVALMRLALKKNPDFGLAHSVMADKLNYLANVYPPAHTPERIEHAAYHMQRTVELASMNPDAMFNLGQAQWHAGQVTDSQATMARVAELDRGHQLAPFMQIVVPYTCKTPSTDVIEEAIAFDSALAPDNPIRWLTLTWISALYANRQEYETALSYEEQAALIFQVPYSFMRHAALLNMLGKQSAAKEVLDRQTTNWPEIDPTFFVSTSLLRLCSETANPGPFIAPYRRLAELVSQK